MSGFQGLDKALRWIRLQRKQKQGEVAARAGVTQAMLCSYEQGTRVPTLASLAKILRSLDSDLVELDRALALVNEEPARHRAGAVSRIAPAALPGAPRRLDLEAALGLDAPLPAAEALTLSRMLDDYCDWLRLLARARAGSGDDEPAPPNPDRWR